MSRSCFLCCFRMGWLVGRVRTIEVAVHPLGGDDFEIRLDATKPSVGGAKAEIARVQGTDGARQELHKAEVRADGGAVRDKKRGKKTRLAEIPATNPADAHSTKKFGLHQPRPSPDSPSSVTGSSKTATTPRPLACPLDGLYGQDSVRSSDGFDGMCNEGDSDGLDYY
jgi:hypothetical protein